MPTGISYVDETWNPVVGCTKCSPGCENCYAERMAKRLWCMGRGDYGSVLDIEDYKWNGKIVCRKEQLNKPLHWRQPRRILCCSMGDLFHESVPDEYRDKVFVNMALCPQHTFLVLTKRVERMAEYCNNPKTPFNTNKIIKFPFPNVHLGVTICNQAEADEILPIGLQIPGFDWVSAEPLLGPVNFRQRLDKLYGWVDWVVVGGESGPGARPMHPDWVRSIRDQCIAAGVPFFFKQWGEWELSSAQGTRESSDEGLYGYNCHKLIIGRDTFIRVGKKKAGRLLDGKEWNQYPTRVRETA